MITTYLKNFDDCTNAEAFVRDYIVANPECIVNCSIKDISNDCHVGVATINRFCQKLGYKGFTDFKTAYIIDYKDDVRRQVKEKDIPFDADSSVDEVIDQIPFVYNKAIEYTKLAINRNAIIRFSELIQNSRLLIYGTGANKAIAEIFAYKLDEIGLRADTYDSTHYQAIQTISSKKEKACAIVLSHSGANLSMVRAAKKLRDLNIPTLVICSKKDSPILQYCSDSINIIPTGNTAELSNTQYTMSIQYILDIILSLLIIKNLQLIKKVAEDGKFYKAESENPKEL